MNRKASITVRFQREGIHKYPAAANIEGVEFLAFPHRHVFHFEVTVEVFHDDRDIEFILFKRELEGLYGSGTLEVDFMSCEMLADDLCGYIMKAYPGRDVSVSVFEDGENGGTVSYTK